MKWVVFGPAEDTRFEAESFILKDGALLFYSDPECAPGQLVVGFAPREWREFEACDE